MCFLTIISEMNKIKRGHHTQKFKVDLKCQVLDLIENLPVKPSLKPYSHREIAKLVKRKMDVKVSDKTIAKWRKDADLLKLTQRMKVRLYFQSKNLLSDTDESGNED